MLKLAVAALVIAVFAAAATYDLWSTPEAVAMAKNEELPSYPAPVVPFATLDGRAFADFSALPEPVVVLNFWASWCPTCVVEMPAMLKLAEELAGKAAFVFVSIDDTKSPMEAFLAKLTRQVGAQATHPYVYWVWDAEKQLLLAHFNVLRVPETVVMTPDQRMVRKIVGEFDWGGDAAKNMLLALSKQS